MKIQIQHIFHGRVKGEVIFFHDEITKKIEDQITKDENGENQGNTLVDHLVVLTVKTIEKEKKRESKRSKMQVQSQNLQALGLKIFCGPRNISEDIFYLIIKLIG